MQNIRAILFRAIHEGKWLYVNYRNKNGGDTKYWIAVREIDTAHKKLRVDGLHLFQHTITELTLFLDSIDSAEIVEGTYYPIPQYLVDDIKNNPHQYKDIFGNVPNLRILNYLADCNRLDAAPHRYEHALIPKLDSDRFRNGDYKLDDEQYNEVIKCFQGSIKNSGKRGNLAMNVISVHPKRSGKNELYVLAYRRLHFDVKERTLFPADNITVCKEFTINGDKQSVRQFIDADEEHLLDDFGKNLETIKNCIAKRYPYLPVVDDMPYMLAVDTDYTLDLEKQYAGINAMYSRNEPTVPLRAFFGELTKRPARRKDYPIILRDKQINLDQLLSISKAMKYPLAYIQGPPGTGKTHTIINTILTAFFNERTVLFSSYNNKPIDGVIESLRKIQYRSEPMLFPVIRLGKEEYVNKAIDEIWRLYQEARKIKLYASTLNGINSSRSEQAKRLNALLQKYEDILDLEERKETTDQLLHDVNHLHFDAVLRNQQYNIDKSRKSLGNNVTIEEALSLLPDDTEQLKKYLHYTAAKYIKRLDEPKYAELLKIIQQPKGDDRAKTFNRWIENDEHFRNFLRVFPVIATTCSAAYHLGDPKPYFDMVMIDEAGQCKTAESLIPVLRGESLTLVGDPQQLNPVILLDERDNRELRKRYAVSDEYDYIKNSVYKTFLACDAVSDEILLSHHYRCHSKIIGFNNKKYYRSKLQLMKKESVSEQPLILIDVKDAPPPDDKNSAPDEAELVLEYIKQERKNNPQKKIGIITPFVNQQKIIEGLLKQENITDIGCGTVHAFQGDEKDVILFSTALTDSTHQKTYDWLKNNKELLNVAVSRAKDQLVVFASSSNLQRLHGASDDDDFYELADYVRSNGVTKITQKAPASRALGIKPYSTKTEEAFLQTLRHAIENLPPGANKYAVETEVELAHIFPDDRQHNDLFYTGRFDFVVYERQGKTKEPLLAVELDGKEHVEEEAVKIRDGKKADICRQHGFALIRVENSYARRYHHIKEILMDYFMNRK